MRLSEPLLLLWRGGAESSGYVESQSEKSERGRGGKKTDGRDVCECAVSAAAGTVGAGYWFYSRT